MIDLYIDKSIRYVFEECILDTALDFNIREGLLNKLGLVQDLSKKEYFYFKLLFGLEYSEECVLNIVNSYAASIGVPLVTTINKKRWYKFIYPRYNKKQQLWFWSRKLKASKENINKSNLQSKKEKSIDIDLFIEDLLYESLQKQDNIISFRYKNISNYRKAVTFSFTPNILPQITGYNKLCKFGWYSKHNILGMTKDHKVSVHYGFINKISPSIIAHPANCEFMSLRENSSKNYNSSITLDTLLKDIKNFNNIMPPW